MPTSTNQTAHTLWGYLDSGGFEVFTNITSALQPMFSRSADLTIVN